MLRFPVERDAANSVANRHHGIQCVSRAADACWYEFCQSTEQYFAIHPRLTTTAISASVIGPPNGHLV
jgi:hypothetical protein